MLLSDVMIVNDTWIAESSGEILDIDEFEKALLSPQPHLLLEALRHNGRLVTLLPEAEPTFDMAQNAYHFGTVWQHTLKALEVVAETTDDLTLRLAILMHDMGKPLARSYDAEKGKVHFIGHEIEGAELSRTVLRRLGYPDAVVEEVAFLILHHMDTKKWGNQCEAMHAKALRKLQYVCATRERFERLLVIIHGDNMAHAEAWCMPDQTRNIALMTDAMQDEGTAMFGFKPWLTDDEVKAIKGLQTTSQVNAYQNYLLKLAFSNPTMDRETAIKCLKGCKLKEK